MQELDWNEQAKRLLKAELVRRGITNEDLVRLLENIGIEETKASIDSKISRGSFSAAFFLQCLNVIGCKNLDPMILQYELVSEPTSKYLINKTLEKK